MTDKKRKSILDYLEKNEEVGFIDNNIIVEIHKTEDGYDFSFFRNRIEFLELNDHVDFKEYDNFDPSDFSDDLIDGGQLDTNDVDDVLDYCIMSAGVIDPSISPSSEADDICQECWDPDCTGCNN